MKKAPCAAAELMSRWQRVQTFVRCGLSVCAEDYVRLYLLIGHRVARLGLRPPMAVQRQMLGTLLRTAEDEALPWSHRSACLEQSALPAACLRVLLGMHDTAVEQVIDDALQRAGERRPGAALSLPPRRDPQGLTP